MQPGPQDRVVGVFQNLCMSTITFVFRQMYGHLIAVQPGPEDKGVGVFQDLCMSTIIFVCRQFCGHLICRAAWVRGHRRSSFSKPLHEHYNICVPSNAWFSDLLGNLGQRSRLLKFSRLLHKHYDICVPSDVWSSVLICNLGQRTELLKFFKTFA